MFVESRADVDIPSDTERRLVEQRELAFSPFSGESVKEKAWVVIDFILDSLLELERLESGK